jgi:lipopolysaccharide transport system permease protein
VQATESQALAAAAIAPNGRVHRIQPSPWLVPVNFGELWRHRALIGFFILRDIKSRYRQTYLGPVWGIIRPLLTIVVFSVIFGHLARIKTTTTFPYALWVTPAVVAFAYVGAALNATSMSLIGNGHLIGKVYFPRLYVPISTALTPILDLLLSLLVVLGLFAWFRQVPSWHIVFLPAFMALSALVCIGFGIWLSAFTGRYRDMMFAVPFVVQIWQYATPVIYPQYGFFPARFQWVITLNPFTAVVSGFRWSLLATPFGTPWTLVSSLGIGVAATLSGLYVFRRAERFMVDTL